MNTAARKFEVVEGGSLGRTLAVTNEPTNEPLMNPDPWVDGKELAELSGVSYRAVAKGIEARHWRGVALEVREQASNVGRGGKVLRVHVDSLPADLRQAWYLERGIELHEKPDPSTGKMVLVPEQSWERDARHEKALGVAHWRHEIIRPALALPKQSPERSRKLDELAEVIRRWPGGQKKPVPRRTLYNWVRHFEDGNAGLAGLMPKIRKDKGAKRASVTRTWDRFFASHITADRQGQVADQLTHYIRSLWGSGERGKYAVAEKATTRLIELSRDLGVVAFDRLALGRPVSQSGTGTQFELCFVNTRRVTNERKFQMLAIKRKDNARFQDEFVPHIMRDYSAYKPRDIIVGDVHPTDVMMKREDGSQVYPKAISWLDIATNEIHMTFVLLEKGEGVKREHVAMAFEAMVEEWGLPKLLYLDNGSEYKWAEMIGGFTQLSKLTEGSFAVHDLGDNSEVHERVMGSREAVIRSLAYNAKGKPKIEGAFGNIEQVQFALLPGWTAGDRMSKKTHAKGKDPEAFGGSGADFLRAASTMLEWYHKRPQRGRLDGRSPNEALGDFIKDGWGKTVLGNPDVLALAFAEEVVRTPRSGRVSYKSRHGDTSYFYADALLNITHPITLRVPAYKPEFVFCFDGERFLGIARPERSFGVLDRAGAEELGRRKKVFHREIAEMARHCALLDLVAETARHNQHMADTPEAPVAVTVDVDALNRLAIAAEQERKALAGQAARPRSKAPEQWKTGPNEMLKNFAFAEDEDE